MFSLYEPNHDLSEPEVRFRHPQPDPFRSGSQAKALPKLGGIDPRTPVETKNGPVQARLLSKGDRVLTLHHGFRPLIWVGRIQMTYVGYARDTPVRFAPGAVGKSRFSKPSLFAPHQKMCLHHIMNEVFFGTPDVVATCRDLVSMTGISRVERPMVMDWVQLLFDATELVQADGLWCESLLPDMDVLRGIAPRQASEIEGIVPALRFETGKAAYTQTCPELNEKEIELLRANGSQHAS
ncbi:MAG TPA: hypothetical protein ENK28_02755 [Aliiroseovarius sp.]|nr:hypothetical protein [Aliiroseovarius sp.]